MSLIRFLYKSQYIVDDTIREGSTHPVTGGAVYEAIERTRTNTVLQSGYISNCLATVDKQHILTYADGTLKLAQGSKVFVPAGKEPETGEFIFNTFTLTKDVTATANNADSMNSFMFINTEDESWVGNAERTLVFDQDSQTYLDSAIQRVFAQDEAPRIDTAGVIWWDTANNLIKEYSSVQSDWVTTQYSIPICRVSKNTGLITGIIQDFLTCGYCCYAVWVNPGNEFLLSNGRTDDGTYNVISMTTENVICKILENSAEGYEDYCFYITSADEIVGPVEALSFDTASGYFVDADGTQYTCTRFANASAGHLTTPSTDPLTISSFVPKDCLTLADSDDVENLIALIGSSTGDTIDSLLARIQVLEQQHEADVAALEQAIQDSATSTKDQVDEEVVHKALDETITGNKTFTQIITGDITGNANTLTKEETSVKVLYPCGVESYADGKEQVYVNTTVTFGANYVEADEFRGIATHTRWADLAEVYQTDKEYPVGTIVKWGGEKELTIADPQGANAVISEKPAHLMNSDMEGQPIALVGRVRIRVLGPVKKFQCINQSEIPGVGKASNFDEGLMVGRALEDKEFPGEGLVLCAVNFRI